jgi:Bacterial regulatory helix-turn-helix protein, lysR family
MEIRQLEYFRAVVEEGTVSGAAKVLKMTQPPVSYQMKMLEEELDVQLFFVEQRKLH